MNREEWTRGVTDRQEKREREEKGEGARQRQRRSEEEARTGMFLWVPGKDLG